MSELSQAKDSRLAWDDSGVYYVARCPTCGGPGRPRRWVFSSALSYEGKGGDGRDLYTSYLDVFDSALLDVMVEAANAHLDCASERSEGR